MTFACGKIISIFMVVLLLIVLKLKTYKKNHKIKERRIIDVISSIHDFIKLMDLF